MIRMSENGNSVRPMATVFIFGSMGIDIKETSSKVSSMAMEKNNFPMGIDTKETTTTANHMVTVSIIGETEPSTKEDSYKGKEMASEFGKLQ